MWLDMPSLRCMEECGYVITVTEILTQYVDVSSSSFPVASSSLVVFYRTFDQMHVYSHSAYWVNETISERRLRTCADRCFINRLSVDV